jgi:hypothetical protein
VGSKGGRQVGIPRDFQPCLPRGEQGFLFLWLGNESVREGGVTLFRVSDLRRVDDLMTASDMRPSSRIAKGAGQILKRGVVRFVSCPSHRWPVSGPARGPPGSGGRSVRRDGIGALFGRKES